MKNTMLLIFLAFLPLSLSAQKEQTSISLDLAVGQVLQLDQSSVKFLKVISDSRCPEQVTCVWAGEAKVLLGISVGKKYFEKEVVVSGNGAELALSEDLQILTSQLLPYPKKPKEIAPEDYRLILETLIR